MDTIDRPRRLLHRPTTGALLGVFAFIAIIATACGSGDAGEVASSTSELSFPAEVKIPLTPDPAVDTGQPFAAAAAAVEFDAEAFARITPGGPREVDPSRFRQLIGRDVIVPIYDPLIVSAAEAGFTPDELVMGVALNGESRAYSVGMMRSREIANDELGGVPLLVTW